MPEGCELTSDPPAVEPNASKLVTLFFALLDLEVHPRASPASSQRAMGLEQWFCLLSRPMFSVFDATYEFMRRELADIVDMLPDGVKLELTVAAVLMPLLGADLSRAFLLLLTACDAS